MAFKPALCRADQSSSFGHLRPPPQTSITTTPNCLPLHIPHHARATHSSPGIFDINDTALRVGALDKALDIWYNTGVGLKKNTQTGAMNDND